MKKGFTLIELLIVVLIIGILTAVALPQYEKAVEKSRAAEAITILTALRQQQALCYLQNGGAVDSCGAGDEGNLFDMTDVLSGVTGAPEADCDSSVCGPTSQYFSYELDGQDIFASRKPANTKYYLSTTVSQASDAANRNRIACYNTDENKNWCIAIGFSKPYDGRRSIYIQP